MNNLYLCYCFFFVLYHTIYLLYLKNRLLFLRKRSQKDHATTGIRFLIFFLFQNTYRYILYYVLYVITLYRTFIECKGKKVVMQVMFVTTHVSFLFFYFLGCSPFYIRELRRRWHHTIVLLFFRPRVVIIIIVPQVQLCCQSIPFWPRATSQPPPAAFKTARTRDSAE